MRKLSKFELIIGILGFMLLLALLCFCAFMFFIFFAPCKAVNTEVEEELSRIKARGEPVTLKELAPPLIPDDENAAFVYEKAFKIMGEIPQEVKDLLEKRPSELTLEQRTTLKNFLDKNKEVFLILDKAIAFEKCRFPVDYEKGLLVELPHLGKLRDCARLLALKSIWELNEGNTEQAVDTSLKMIRLSNSLSTEPIYDSQLVRITIGNVMIDSLEKILAEGDLSVETLRRLIDILDTFRKETRDGLKLAFLGERCLFIAAFDPDFFAEGFDIPIIILRLFTGSRFMKSDKLYGLGIWKRFIDFTHLPLHQAIRESKELVAELDKRFDEAWEALEMEIWEANKWPPIFSTILLPAMGRSLVRWAHHEAKIEKARIAAALELYKREHNVYPEYLRDIPADVLSPLPKDPFTDEDFIYKRKNDNFLLYSVGENLKDDGGVSFIQPEGRRRERADIVWGNN